MTRTIEQILKYDNGLTIGQTCVTIERRDGSQYIALVEIGKRGKVSIIKKPDAEDMYSSWYTVKGNETKVGTVIVWGARDPELMSLFDNPVKTISFKTP